MKWTENATRHSSYTTRTTGTASGAFQIIQNVDVYATVLDALGKPLPQGRHGISLLARCP